MCGNEIVASATPDGRLCGDARAAMLSKLAHAMHTNDSTGSTISIAVSLENDARCSPPLDDAELLAIVATAQGRGELTSS